MSPPSFEHLRAFLPADEHFYASLLIAAGESVRVVQVRLGHASAKVTLDTYAHLWLDSEDRTRAAVDQVLGENVAIPRTSRGHLGGSEA